MHIDSGDTAWVLVCTALVLLMTPGLAFFYAGMVRAKHVLGMLMQNYVAIARRLGRPGAGRVLAGLRPGRWSAGSSGVSGLAGLRDAARSVPGLDADHPADRLHGVPADVRDHHHRPAQPARSPTGCGSAASSLFAAVWSVLVYAPLAHWSFSPGGWLAQCGLLGLRRRHRGGDLLRRLVAGAGPRHRARGGAGPTRSMAPHNLPLTCSAPACSGSAGSASTPVGAAARARLAAQAVVSTHLPGCGGMLGWLALEKRLTGQRHDARCGVRRGGRPGRDHARRRLRRLAAGSAARRAGRHGLPAAPSG